MFVIFYHFLFQVCTFFRHNAIARLIIDYSTVQTQPLHALGNHKTHATHLGIPWRLGSRSPP